MDVEEERKAFIETLKPRLIGYFGCGAFAEGYNKDTFDAPGVQFFFEGWLAAKEHAANQLKPEVTIKKSVFKGLTYPWLVCHAAGQYQGQAIEGFKTKKEATNWATNGGYRVVDK